MKTYKIPYGRGFQTWESPYDFITPQPHDKGLCGASPCIDEALDAPIGSPSLEELVGSAEKITVVCPDITRGWCKAPTMNAAVRNRIASVTDKPVTWLVATGQHRAMTDAEKDFLFADAARPGDVMLSHDCEKVVDMGVSTPSGTPVSLDAAFVEADLVVLVGGIIFHDMAGFSGGRKNIMPGVSGRMSIVINHNHTLKDGGLNPDTNGGLLEHNPMAIDQMDYAMLAVQGKKCFLLNAIADRTGKPVAWVAGDLREAWKAGTEACKSLTGLYVPARAKRLIVSAGGYPNDLDLYQASKGLFAALPGLEKGCPVVLVADMEDAVGPGNFRADLISSIENRNAYLAHLEKAFTIPGYVALRTILELDDYPAALVTSRDDCPFPGKIFRTVQEADEWLREVSGTEGLSLMVESGNAIHVSCEE